MAVPALLALATAAAAPSTLTIPLHWAQPEGRLVFNVSVGIASADGAAVTYHESVTRIDLGSEIKCGPCSQPVRSHSPYT